MGGTSHVQRGGVRKAEVSFLLLLVLSPRLRHGYEEVSKLSSALGETRNVWRDEEGYGIASYEVAAIKSHHVTDLTWEVCGHKRQPLKIGGGGTGLYNGM